MGRSSKRIDEAGLIELAFRRLNLARSRWTLECILYSDRVLLRTIHTPSRRSVDRSVAYRKRADLEPLFLAAVRESVAQLSAPDTKLP